MKNTKIFGITILLSILILSVMSFANAALSQNEANDMVYNFELRSEEVKNQIVQYTNNDLTEWNTTFTITRYTFPTGGASSISFDFDPVTVNNVSPTTTIESTMTITATDHPILGKYTADITVEKIPSAGGEGSSEVIHNITIEVVPNKAPNMTGVEDFNLIIGETKTIIVYATDEDEDNLTFALVGEPSGMSMIPGSVPDTVEISWAPIVFVASTDVQISVYDGYDTTTETFTASATDIGMMLEIEAIEFGSDSQEREELVTATFNIMNTGDETIAGLSIESSNVNEDYAFTILTPPLASIASGETTTFTARLFIPLDQDSGSLDIGDMLINYDTNNQMSEEITLITESFLDVDGLRVYINGDSEGSIDEGDEVEVEIEDEVELEIRLENTDNEYNFDDGIELTFEIDELNIDEDEDYDDDLDEGETSDEIEITFTIPSDEDDGVVEAILTVTAEDENGAEHTIEYIFEFDVDKPSHMIKINDVTLSTSTVISGRTAEVQIEIENLGRDDEDEVYIEILNDDLGLDEKIGPYDLDEGDELTRSISFEIPEDAEGEYVLYLRTYYDRTDFSDSEIISLNVVSDGTTSSETESTNDQGTTVTTTPAPTSPINNPTYGEPIESSFFGSDSSVLILLIVLIVVMIGVMVVILIPSKGVKK